MPEPENLVLTILREMRAEMATKADVASVRSDLKSEIADLRSEVHSLRADVASDMLSLEKRLGDQIATLRRAVMNIIPQPSATASSIWRSTTECGGSNNI